MRSRTIKPSFFTNEDLAQCHPLARILFVGLWGMADRDGRLEDRPARIKATVLPYDNCNTDELLNELQGRKFILRYTLNDRKFIQIQSFAKHAKPHPDERSENHPAPPEPGNPVKSRGKKLNAVKLPAITLTSSSSSSLLGAAAPLPENESSGKRSDTAQTPLDCVSNTALTPSDTSEEKSGRPRNELFDAVQEVTASDPKVSGAHIGRVCKLLRSADPPYTPDEVRRWAEMIRAEWKLDSAPTLGMLEKYIGRVRGKANSPRPRTKAEVMAEVRRQREEGKRLLESNLEPFDDLLKGVDDHEPR